MVIYHEDIVLIEDTTIVADKGKMIHREKELALTHCTSEQGACETEDSTYVWDPRPNTCNLKSTKIIPGEIIEFKEFKYFISNHALMHL